MRTDVEIKHDGYQAIFEKLDIVEAEKFITLLRRDKFDYTKWREHLFESMSLEELSIQAMNHWRKKKDGEMP